MSAEYTAVCECGRSNRVEPTEMGQRFPCYCGFMLILPPLDEFQHNPVQKAYPSVLRKVAAHIEQGLLPGIDDCQGCGTPTDRTAEALVVCERSKTTGGSGVWVVLLMLFAILFGPIIILFGSESVTEYHGRDTNIRVPARLCVACQRRLGSRWNPVALGVLVVGVIVSVVVGVFAGWWATLPVAVTMSASGLIARVARGRQRQVCKEVLAVVPDYAELLNAYRFAEVRVPPVK